MKERLEMVNPVTGGLIGWACEPDVNYWIRGMCAGVDECYENICVRIREM